MKTKKVLFPALAVMTLMLSACNTYTSASASIDLPVPAPDPETEISANDAYTKTLSMVKAQKSIATPTKLTLHELVNTKETIGNKLNEQYSYDYTCRLDTDTGYYCTNLVQDSLKWNNTLNREVELRYEIEIHIWTDSAYRTTMTQKYLKYQDGVKIENELIYAQWNLGYYQDYSTKFGTGKFAALKEILNHFFSDTADEGEEVTERDAGEYNVEHMASNFFGSDDLSSCLSASSAIAAGKQYRPYTDAKNFVGHFYSDGTDSIEYQRSYDVGYLDENYGNLTVEFNQDTKWTDNICAYSYDHRNFYNDTYQNDQEVFDTYSLEDYEEEIPDYKAEGYVELDLTY